MKNKGNKGKIRNHFPLIFNYIVSFIFFCLLGFVAGPATKSKDLQKRRLEGFHLWAFFFLYTFGLRHGLR
jgi:hypothetical protein